MSTIYIASPAATSGNEYFLAVNSEGSPNEAQTIIRLPKMARNENIVECTLCEIPQISQTHEVLISKPYHCWGAEFGCNEHGLSIAYNHVISKYTIKEHEDQGKLIPQDIIRLALERSSTCEEAQELICTLIEEYKINTTYNRSFGKLGDMVQFVLIDKKGVKIIECFDQEWMVYRTEKNTRLFNHLPIQGEIREQESETYAQKLSLLGIKGNEIPMELGEKIVGKSPRSYKRILKRERLAKLFVDNVTGKLSLEHIIELLQLKNTKKDRFAPHKSKWKDMELHTTKNINLQTNHSFIVQIKEGRPPICWFTGTPRPGLSVFKPFFFHGKNYLEGLIEEAHSYADDTLWWRSELFIRRASKNYNKCKPYFYEELTKFQVEVLTQFYMLDFNNLGEESQKLTEKVVNKHRKYLLTWHYQLEKDKIKDSFWTKSYNQHIDEISEKVIPIIK